MVNLTIICKKILLLNRVENVLNNMFQIPGIIPIFVLLIK